MTHGEGRKKREVVIEYQGQTLGFIGYLITQMGY